MKRRELLISAGAFAVGAAIAPSITLAADFPSKPIRLMIPFAAGGVGDTIGRALMAKTSEILGQTIVVENRPGAGGIIGTQAAAKSPADGYMILQVTGANVIASRMQATTPYDIEADFDTIIGIGAFPNVLVTSTENDLKSFADLVERGKQGGKASFASGGIGSLGHLCMEQLLGDLGVTSNHLPFTGNSAAMPSLLGNQVDLLFTSTIDVDPMIREGKLRPLAVSSPERLPQHPDVPTTAELGYAHVQPQVWYGYVVPAGTSAEVTKILHDAMREAIQSPELQEMLGKLGYVTTLRDPQAFDEFVSSELKTWGDVITKYNVQSNG